MPEGLIPKTSSGQGPQRLSCSQRLTPVICEDNSQRTQRQQITLVYILLRITVLKQPLTPLD